MTNHTPYNHADDHPVRDALAGVAVAIVAVALIALIAFGAWHLFWRVKKADVDRDVQIRNRNTGTQTAWRDEARATVSQFHLTPTDQAAARSALRTQACDLIVRLRPDYRTADLDTFYAQEC